jgi:hypothetical protein
MTRFDWRWVRRHPLRWATVMWFPWFVATILVMMATIIDQPVFAPVIALHVWPILVAVTAGAAAASALAPLEPRLQAATAALIFGTAVLRLAALLYTTTTGVLSAGGNTLAFAFGLHWAFMAGVAILWPQIVERAGRMMAVEAGRDDRGGA